MRHEHDKVDRGAFSVLEGKNRFQSARSSLASITKLTSINESFGGEIPVLIHYQVRKYYSSDVFKEYIRM